MDIAFIYNVLVQFLLIFGLIIFAVKFVKTHNLSLLIVLLLILVHFGFTYLNSFTSYNTKTDAPRYFRFALEANSWFSLFGLSTTFIKFLIYPLIHFFKFNYTTLFVVFSLFSIYGYLILYKILNGLEYARSYKILGISLTLLILFLPSFHFWTSLLGKDSLVFLFSMLALNRFVYYPKSKRNTFLLILLLLMLTFIRPYIGVFVFVAAIMVYILENLTFKKVIIGILISIVGGYIVVLVFKRLNIDVFTFLNERIEWLSRYISRKEEGSFIDPTELTVFEKMFAYMFRPLFIDAKGISQILISIENALFFIMTLQFFKFFKWKNFIKSFKAKLLVLYCLIFVVIKAYLLYNLGISNRQKYMILPILFYLLYYFINENRKTKYSTI